MIWLFIVLIVAIALIAIAPEAVTQFALVAVWGLMAIGVLFSLVRAIFY